MGLLRRLARLLEVMHHQRDLLPESIVTLAPLIHRARTVDILANLGDPTTELPIVLLVRCVVAIVLLDSIDYASVVGPPPNMGPQPFPYQPPSESQATTLLSERRLMLASVF